VSDIVLRLGGKCSDVVSPLTNVLIGTSMWTTKAVVRATHASCQRVCLGAASVSTFADAEFEVVRARDCDCAVLCAAWSSRR
jgi:hypothetical protein